MPAVPNPVADPGRAVEEGASGRRLSPDQRRRQLLEHGLRAFTSAPFGEVKLAEVAAGAGVSEGLLFRYFGDKESFYRESILAGLELAATASDPDPSRPAAARFRQGLKGYVALVERFPYAIPHVMLGGPAADPEIQAAVERARRAVTDRIVSRIEAPDPPKRLTDAVGTWLTFVQVSTVEWLNHHAKSREELLREQVAVFRALAAEALGIEPRPTPPGGDPPYLP